MIVDAPPSAEPLARLLRLITDQQMMEAMLSWLAYDVRRAPLGALRADTLLAGARTLKRIEDALSAGPASRATLSQLSSAYYTLVPHAFGMKTPPVIDSTQAVQREMELLRALGDVQAATELAKPEEGVPVNPLE